MWDSVEKALTSMYSAHPFLTGSAFGVVICLLARLLFRFVLRRYRGMTKVSEISYPMPSGQISIRASAVATLVFSLESDFPEFTMISTGLYRKEDFVVLKVVVDYHPGDRPFANVVSLFQKSVQDKLKESFGIETVKEIEICMRDSVMERSGHKTVRKENDSPAETDSEKTEESNE